MIDTPYPGLRPFRRDEVNVFFGRDRQIDAMLAVLAGEGHFLAVTGASGAGKSSLVKTGLYSALELGYMRSAGAHWRIVEARPQTHPLAELREAFIESLGADADDSIRGLIAAAVSRSPEAVAQSIGAIMEKKRESLLIVIDQFEELFRYKRTGADDEAFAFVAMLLQLAKQRKYPIYVVITVRSDYLGECAAFDGLSEAVNKALYLTPQMTRDELGEAITAPAAVYDGLVEPALVARMLNDLERERDQLPLMQHALARLWEEAARINPDSPQLTLAMYDKIGGVTGALEQHANSILAELGSRAYIAERMFRQLVGVTETADDVRNPTQFGQLLALTRSKREDLVPVIEAFRRPDRSFLAPPEGDLTDDVTIDITHESLIRQWPDLREWATAEAADASQYRRIHESARLYRKGEEALLTSPALENALAWRDRVKPTLEWATRHMRDQSKVIGARSVRRQVEHDFAGAMAFLDESERVARQEREAAERARQKATSRLRFQAVSYFALFLVALVGLVYAAFAYRDASISAEAAKRSAEVAKKAEETALAAQAETEKARVETQTALDRANDVISKASVAQADYLAATAIGKFGDRDLIGAVALAQETDFLASSATMTGLSTRALTRLQNEIELPGGTVIDTFGTVSKLTDTSGFNGGGKWIGVAQTGDAYTVSVWNVETGSAINSVPVNNTPWLGSIRPGLDVGAAVQDDGEAVLFSLSEAGKHWWLREPDEISKIYALSLSGEPGAERAVVATFDENYAGEVQLWDVSGSASRQVMRLPLPALTGDDYPDTAFFDSKAGRFAIVSRDGAILVGSVANDVLTIDGFLPKALFDSTMRHVQFDTQHNRLVGLIDQCLFTQSLDTLVSQVPPVNATCEDVGLTVQMTTPILTTRMTEDGQALIAANDSAREILDLRDGQFGRSLQYISYLDQTHLAFDVDLKTGSIVGNNSDLGGASAFFQSVVPGASFPCTGICDFVTRIDADDLIYGDSGDGASSATATLFRLHTNADRPAEVFPVGQPGYASVVGVSRDGTSVALADAGMTQIRTYQLDGNKLSGTVTLTDPQQTGGAATPAGGLSMSVEEITRKEEDKLISLGMKFVFSDPAVWPAYFVPRSAAETKYPTGLTIYSGVADWLATSVTEQGLEVNVGGVVSTPLAELASDRPTAMTFTTDGKVLLVGTTRGQLWALTSTANGVNARTLIAGYRDGTAGYVDGAIEHIDVSGNDIVVSGGSAGYYSVVRAKLDSSEVPEELESLYAKWVGTTPTGIVTLGVTPAGTPADLDRIQEWSWGTPKQSAEERALALLTAKSTGVTTDTLQDLYFIPEFLTASFRAHFGSDACAAEAVVNQAENKGIGCRAAMLASPLLSDAILGHGLELLRSDAALSTANAQTFSGMTPMESDTTTDSIEEGQLFVITAAAAGDGNAMAVLADQLAPGVAAVSTIDGVVYSDRALVPSFGWRSTIDLLQRIYADGGPLPSAVVELVTQPISSADSGTAPDGTVDPVAVAVSQWRLRIAEPKYAADPIAQLALTLLSERDASSSKSPEDLLSAYAKLIPQLDRPADQRAVGIAKERLAALARSLGPQRGIDELRAAQSAHQQRPSNAVNVTLDPAMAAYVAVLSDPTQAASLRPAALATALASFLDMLTPATKASLPPYVELRLLTEKLDADAPVAELTALAGQVVARARLLDMDYTPRSLVTALLLQLDGKEALWRTDLERELLQLYAGLIGSNDATYDQQVMAAAMRVVARGRDVELISTEQAAYDAVEHLILRSFDAALDGFSYDSDRLNSFNAQLSQLAAASERFAPGQDTFVLAMKGLITTTDAEHLQSAPALLEKYSNVGAASYWASGNWTQAIYGYTSHAQAFRQDATRNADPEAIRAEIALLQVGLDLDERLMTIFSPGMTERLDRASALQLMARLQTDLAAELRDLKDEDGAVQTYRDSLVTMNQALTFRLAGYSGNNYYGSTMDSIRETYSLMAMVYDRLGEIGNSLMAVSSAVSYGRQAYDYDKSTLYLENYLLELTSQVAYSSRAEGNEPSRTAYEAFTAISALDSYDRNQALPGYIGDVLSRIAYALGSQYFRLQTGLTPDQCDTLAGSPYDPFRRAPGVIYQTLLDPLPAIAACQTVLAADDGADELKRGRIIYQLGRAVERAEDMGIAVTAESSATYYAEAERLNYPMAFAPHGDDSAIDAGYFAQMATFYNLTLERVAEPLATYFEAQSSIESADIASWLRSEYALIGDRDTHWLVSGSAADY